MYLSTYISQILLKYYFKEQEKNSNYQVFSYHVSTVNPISYNLKFKCLKKKCGHVGIVNILQFAI